MFPNMFPNEDFVVSVIERHMEKSKINLKKTPIIVSGGFTEWDLRTISNCYMN